MRNKHACNVTPRAAAIAMALSASTIAAPPQRAQTTRGPVVPAATELSSPAGPGAMAPHVAEDTAGGIWLTWLEPIAAPPPGEPGSAKPEAAPEPQRLWSLRTAHLDAHSNWSPASTIAAGSEFFANWADTPGVTPAPGGALYAHFLERIDSSSPYAYGVVLMRSDDRGGSWLRLGTAHTDHRPVEHGFVSTLSGPDRLSMVWLDGRAMTGDGHDEEAAGDMALMARTIVPGQEHLVDEVPLDPRTCECCNTGMAMTSRGPIVVYRDRGDDERRDISCVRLVDGKWTEPRDVARDGWILPGCPVNGPAVAASGETVVVAWYTAADGRALIKAAISTDCGETFREPIVIADELGAERRTPHGRVAAVIDPDRRAAYVLWLGDAGPDEAADLPLAATRDAAEPVYAKTPAGALRLTAIDLDTQAVASTRTIALADASRSGGFPRIARLDRDRLFTAWTDTTSGRQVRTAIVSLAD